MAISCCVFGMDVAVLGIFHASWAVQTWPVSLQVPQHAHLLTRNLACVNIGCKTRHWWLAGDHGDPDLASALKHMSTLGRPVPLVVFGHMHHMLKGGKRKRNMVHIDADSGTVFLNCAVVPRWGSNPVAQHNQDVPSSQFTVVHMAADGYVQSASYVWVETPGSQCCIASEQEIIKTSSHVQQRLVRQFLVTGDASGGSNGKPFWESVETASPLY